MPEITVKEFDKFRELIHQKAGISIADNKIQLVQARVGRRLRFHDMHSFDEYYKLVVDDRSGHEMVQLLDAISINLTSFFREPSHFQFLNDVMPRVMEEKKKSGNSRIRAWSAGCSSGEEPYTLGMNIGEHCGVSADGWDAKILGTDLSTRVLAEAQAGVYHGDKVRSIAPHLLRKYLVQGTGEWSDNFRVGPQLSSMVVFRRLNLMDPKYPFKGPFDFIFCRNVMIYFNREFQQTLINRFYDYLGPGGYLFIGHSESLTSLDHKFKYVRPTVYKK